MSIAGPAAWKPLVADVGLARVRSKVPLWSNTMMSGVNGFVGSNSPVPKLPCSLYLLGKPCPDSSTKTSNPLPTDRKAIPVGKFRPALKTETVNPAGRIMSLPVLGLNSAVLSGQSGLATVPATATVGSVRTNATANVKLSPRVLANRVKQLIYLPFFRGRQAMRFDPVPRCAVVRERGGPRLEACERSR